MLASHVQGPVFGPQHFKKEVGFSIFGAVYKQFYMCVNMYETGYP